MSYVRIVDGSSADFGLVRGAVIAGRVKADRQRSRSETRAEGDPSPWMRGRIVFFFRRRGPAEGWARHSAGPYGTHETAENMRIKRER